MTAWIKSELHICHQWTKKALTGLKKEDWNRSPPGFKSNVNWQVGHMIISGYFHSILSINGSDEKIKAQFDPKEYGLWYGMGSDPKKDLDKKPDTQLLLANLNLLDKRGLEILSAMNESDLETGTILKNPMAVSKKDALLWHVKHRMWHLGQVTMIKSHLDIR
jgi:hypothetical protein